MEINFGKSLDQMGFYSLIEQFARLNVGPANEHAEIDRYARDNKIGKVFEKCVQLVSYSHIYFQYPKWKQRLLRDKKNKLPDWDIYGYWLQFHVPFKFISEESKTRDPTSRSNVCCPVRVCFFYLFLLYMTIKYTIVAIFHVSYDRASKNFQPDLANLKKNTDYTDNCLLLHKLKDQDRKYANQISIISKYLKFLGSPSNVDGLFFPYLLLLTATAFFVLITFALLYPNNPKFRLNSWNLHFNPLLERRRLQSKMRDLVYGIINNSVQEELNKPQVVSGGIEKRKIAHRRQMYRDCAINLRDESKLAKYYDNFCKYLRRKRNSESSYKLAEGSQFKHRRSNINAFDLHDHRDSGIDWVEFANLFKWFESLLEETNQLRVEESASRDLTIVKSYTKDVKNSDTLQMELEKEDRCERFELIPAHLTLVNYKRLVKRALLVIVVSFICLTSIGFVCAFVILIRESESRIEQRYAEIKCRFWNPAAIPRRMFPKLCDFGHPMDELAYIAIGRSNDLKLALRYEMPAMLNLQTMQFCTEIFWFYAIYCVWVSVYFLTAALNHMNQTQWLDQINCQLQICSSLMEKLSQCDERLHGSLFARKQIERALSICYINFMLFRREQKYDRPLFKFAVLQLSLIVFFGGLVTIWALRNMDDRNGIVMWSISMFIVTLLNMMVHLLVTFTNKIYNIFDQLNGIMCKSVHISMQSSAIVSLWRRQIMSPQEVFNNFGVEIVGIKFTQANFIQFNSYIFGLSLYFLRSYF